MKVRDLINKIGNEINIEINGKAVTEAEYELEIERLTIHRL